MKMRLTALLIVCLPVFHPSRLVAQAAPERSPAQIFSAALEKVTELFDATRDAPGKTYSTRLALTRAQGLPAAFADQKATLAFQAPDRLLISAEVGGKPYSLGRDRQELWIHAPDKKFGVLGKRGVARFATNPETKDTTRLGAIKFPVSGEQSALLPILLNYQPLTEETVGGGRCFVLKVTAKPEAVESLKFPTGTFTLWIRTNDSMLLRIGYREGERLDLEVTALDPAISEPWPDEKWNMPAQAGDKVETAALSHLTRFLAVAMASLSEKVPPLGPATGQRAVVATEGEGRLERIDGTRVLFLKGSPEEMGRQHGVLLKKEVRDTLRHILYGVGVGSSFSKGRWFFGEIEQAQARLQPFMDPKYLQEMDALALASGSAREEIRLSNFFPELFHCSGFALYGEATAGGKLFHGRILDYLKGVGLEQNAVVIVSQPTAAHAWVNISYAGFIGSVTAMNEKKVAIGEMGGRGEGNWDGKPMAQLVREVMEKASTLDEALAIMRQGPRTCEYYYVVSDGKTRRAVGIAATPQKFETVWAGEKHPLLPHAVKDAVLLSAGDRYEKLVERVREGHGKFDAASARDLMKRPVCMKSNIHSVLFAPETLDFWVANADSQNVASHARYTHYNLADLLKSNGR